MVERAFVISDTHIGAGKNDPLESFYQDDVFEQFVCKIANTDTTLYINGDFIDFAQIVPQYLPYPLSNMPKKHLFPVFWDEHYMILALVLAMRQSFVLLHNAFLPEHWPVRIESVCSS